jgi:hypothetical protein
MPLVSVNVEGEEKQRRYGSISAKRALVEDEDEKPVPKTKMHRGKVRTATARRRKERSISFRTNACI